MFTSFILFLENPPFSPPFVLPYLLELDNTIFLLHNFSLNYKEEMQLSCHHNKFF